jgi:hypothetical protein
MQSLTDFNESRDRCRLPKLALEPDLGPLGLEFEFISTQKRKTEVPRPGKNVKCYVALLNHDIHQSLRHHFHSGNLFTLGQRSYFFICQRGFAQLVVRNLRCND